MSFSPPDTKLIEHLKALYSKYRHTKDIDAKGPFFSPNCLQICRPQPSFAARNRETIIRYLHESAAPDRPKSSTRDEPEVPQMKGKGYYTIRPLRDSELEFGTDEHVHPAGFQNASDVKAKAVKERWVGMRVDLWDDEGVDEQGKAKGTLVKVQYWWREEGEEWLQIFHDIMFIGARDGSEGSNGVILE